MKKIITKKGVISSSIITIILIIGIIIVGKNAWNSYKLEIVELQKEQLLTTVQVLADSIEDTIQYRVDDLEYIAELIEESSYEDTALILDETILENALAKAYITDLTITNEYGDILWGENTAIYIDTYGMSQLTEEIQLIEYKDAEENVVFVLEKVTKNNYTIEMVIDLTKYYEDLISEIQVGTNGYIVVKNSEGIIFMHPEEVQLGIDVIDGRSEIYEGVDLTSLEELVENQMENSEGVYEYYSYWWTQEDIPRVKKVAAHSHANFENDILIVSAVMDYDDIYVPIENVFSSMILTMFMVVGVLLSFLVYVTYLLLKQKKNEEEIIYLKELNQVLEETKKTEETISHQQRLQIMGTMTGGIAHEFNNMLTPIMGYAELLQCTMDPNVEEYEYTQEILNASEKAKEVIRDISKLSRKNMETVLNYIPANRVLNRSMKMVKSLSPTHIRIVEDCNIHNKEGFLCNETQINQVMLNLCVNAFHALENCNDGEVVVSCNCIFGKDIESLYDKNIGAMEIEYIHIAVKDNGCGMEKATVDQIFNPFFTTKIGGQGTGLGLSVVEQIVHSHRGHIVVDSNVGEGSQFHLFFPKVDNSMETPHKLEVDKMNLKVIALDDNGKILKLLEKTLKKGGITIDTCANEEEAMQKLEMNQYHVLLIDQHLTHSNSEEGGIDFTVAIGSRFPSIIKIIMVDQVRKEVIEAKQKGFIDSYLEKPVSDLMIIEEIHHLCNLNKV